MIAISYRLVKADQAHRVLRIATRPPSLGLWRSGSKLLDARRRRLNGLDGKEKGKSRKQELRRCVQRPNRDDDRNNVAWPG